MKHRWIRVGSSLLLAMATACVAKSPAPADVVLCSESTGTGTTLYSLFDLSGSGAFGDKPAEVVILTTPSEDLNPWTYFDSQGNFGIVLSEKDHRVTESTTYGRYSYATLKQQDVARTAPVFKRQGAQEKAFGSVGGVIWRMDGSKSEPIGEVAYQDIVTPNGQKRTERMTRLKGAKAWVTDLGPKIVQVGSDGKVVQVGWVGWRKVTTPQSEHMAILMTKSMAKDAKWAGRFDGKVYQDK